MVRRTLLAIGIVCGASAAAAFAFASELSRAGSQLVEGMGGRGRGVSAVRASSTSLQGDLHPVPAPDESARGEYCRFRPSRPAVTATAVPTDTLLGNRSGSTSLIVQGQSRVPKALPPALCPGDTVGTPFMPRLARP